MTQKTNGSRPTVGVLLVDDHVVVRSALRLLIERQPGMMVVGEASNKDEALTIASREQPEIIILDLCLGEENGMDFIPELLAAAEETKIIILTSEGDPTVLRRAVRRGAMGVVSKGASADFLIKAIDRVYAGELWLNRSMTANLVVELRHDSAKPRSAPDPDLAGQLTGREREILSLLAEGMKNKQIAVRLCISDATVRHHLTSILKKLNVSDRLELLVFAYKHNLVSVRQADPAAKAAISM